MSGDVLLVLELKDEVLHLFEKYSPHTWWGDYFDVRFYVVSQVRQMHGERILDAGCNSGIIDHFVPRDNELVGIDRSGDYIKIAKELNKDWVYFVSDLFEFSYEKKFTVVLAIHMIQEFPTERHEEFIDKMLAFLDRNGKLVLTTPNREYGSYIRHPFKLSYDDLDRLLSNRNVEYGIFGYNPLKHRRHPSDRVLSKISLVARKVESKLYPEESARKCKSFYVECIKKK